ncbi:MFS transporter [Methanolobus zinderi]|jgi:MFS family permease|uniref:MFS transporter n=1 Tax=Methanolobus zinderi TaxID=536044 RepID=A0A7D5E8J8_9EURY|nr:MFS transporter [Methanolobus zinderi]KXS41501.1 MAG: major facilitator superfamily protein [Methanolobus sp. T82-4]QLC49535.1 MFS transporter [Methanolobus zinderi]
MSEDNSSKISIYPILSVNFIGTLGLSLVLPFLVFLVERFGGNALVYGILASMYPAFQLVGAPLLGKWSDTYGRKKILFLSQTGTLLSWLIFMLALFIPVVALRDVDSNLLGEFVITIPLILLFIARAFDGLTGGNVSVANAYVADITEEKDRSKNFGRMSVAMNLGFIAGPALAGLLSVTVYGEKLPVLAAIIISLVGVLLIAFFVPESRKCVQNPDRGKSNVKRILVNEHKDCAGSDRKERSGFRDAFAIEHIPYMLLIYFLLFIAFNMFYAAFPVYAIDRLEWDVAEMGFFFSLLSFLLVIVEGPVLSRASKKLSDSRLAIIGSLILGTNFVLLAFSDVLLAYAAAVLFAIGNGFMWPSIQSILSKLAGRTHQGVVQGVSSSFTSIASIVGLVFGGFIYAQVGIWTFIIAAVIVYAAFLMSFRLLSFETTDSLELD